MNNQTLHQFRVFPVTRHIVTHYENVEPKPLASVRTVGEFVNDKQAYIVAEAMAIAYNGTVIQDPKDDMKPYQERVVQEQKDLDVKVNSLTDFLSKMNIEEVGLDMAGLLFQQYDAMREYNSVLIKRIALFS